MKTLKNSLTVFFISFLAVLNGCDDDEPKEIYLEGEPIPGIDIAFPWGFYTAEPLMPKVSPDGKKLLFTGPPELPEWRGLWVMYLDTQQRTLLHPSGRNGDWAPDSEWIVFNDGAEIFKMKIDGAGLAKLILGDGFFEPAWSPTANVIYFGGNQGAGIVNSDGTQLMIIPELGGQGSWHPIEKKIISSKGYSSNSVWRKFPVYNLNNNQIEIIYDAVAEERNQNPKYSNDASHLLFNNDNGIYILNFNENHNKKRVLPNHLYNPNQKGSIKIYTAYPSWHPDGQHIIYEHFKITRYSRTGAGTYVEGVIQFYKVNADDALKVSNLQ